MSRHPATLADLLANLEPEQRLAIGVFKRAQQDARYSKPARRWLRGEGGEDAGLLFEWWGDVAGADPEVLVELLRERVA